LFSRQTPAHQFTASPKPEKNKSLESWIWDAACSIRGARDAPKYSRAERISLSKTAHRADAGASGNGFILPLIITKRLCDVFDDELNRIAAGVGSRKKAFQPAKCDRTTPRGSAFQKSRGIPQAVSETRDNPVRFFLPLEPADPEQPVWAVIRKLTDKIGEGVTTHMRAIAKENPPLQGIIDRFDFNASTHGQRDIDDDHLSNLIEKISEKRLGTQGIIDRVKFGLPPREEQDELAHAFETLDTRIGQIKAKRDLLQDLFRTLLHELMTAKTRIDSLEIFEL
jgi:type I restriction enzyme M protein